jgi:hypothetical protein
MWPSAAQELGAFATNAMRRGYNQCLSHVWGVLNACATILADLEDGRQIESNASGCESNVFIW